jgi:glycosyltransferase involved in cell wall biosynthesis
MPRRRILLLAYACEPGRGSEPGIGWNVAVELAAHHDVWVLTDAANHSAVDAAAAVDGLTVVPFAPPAGERLRRLPGVWRHQFHYPLWMRAAAAEVRRLHAAVGFDLTQHVTYNRYWMPSAAALAGVPFLWGPVGGGEGAPTSFWPDAGLAFEAVRSATRRACELSAGVRRTASRAAIALATTAESAARMRAVGARDVRVVPAVALSDAEVEQLGALAAPPDDAPLRFVSIGRLLRWKGFHLGLRGFARAIEREPALRAATYEVIGSGPAQTQLEREAHALGIADQVRFLGSLSRADTLARLATAHALVHPSLHDSGGFVCLEALAAGRPVLCLATGGPHELVPADAGLHAPIDSPEAAVAAIAGMMALLAQDRQRGREMGEVGRRHVRERHTWARRAAEYRELYDEIAAAPAPVGDAAVAG